MPENKKAFIFSDLHADGRSLDRVINYLETNKFDLVIFAGDVVNMGEPVEYTKDFIERFEKLNLPLLWVPGNNDFGRSYEEMTKFTPSLEGRVVEYFGHKYTGVGGSPASWEGDYSGENSLSEEKIAGTIFVSHYPPYGVNNFEKNDSALSPTVKKFKNAPLAHICGHVHSQWGVGYLGETKVIKLAAVYLGYAAIINLDDLRVNFINLF